VYLYTILISIASIKCVFEENGMAQACRDEPRPPYKKPMAILRAALTQDTEHGGCPDIPPLSE
jgi:hypothetical protein